MENIKLEDQYIQVYDKENLVTDIWIENEQIKIKRYDNRIGHQLFLMPDLSVVDKDMFILIMKQRAISERRSDIKDILRQFNLNKYDLMKLLRKTHGITTDDYLWLRFDNENISYEKIKVRD